jgi:hypothetical protein
MEKPIATCFAEGCEQPIYMRLLHQIPGSSEHLDRRHGLVCPKHPCKWTGLTRMDDNPVRWLKCTCSTCKVFQRQFAKCCKDCGRVPAERMYLGLLYHRKRISKDVRNLLIKACDAGGYQVCGWCGHQHTQPEKDGSDSKEENEQDSKEENEQDSKEENEQDSKEENGMCVIL